MNSIHKDLAPERTFEALPIDNTRGFPQSFSTVFDGASYLFRLYVNLPAESLAADAQFFDLPHRHRRDERGDEDWGHLVVRVERDEGDGRSEVLLLRKVVPELVYETGSIVLAFPGQRLARANLNGQGEHGSQIDGRIARRWA